MITLYTWTTPNGRKISILLEELGVAYEVKPINIGANEQFAPAFLAVSPNNKIPAIVDSEGPDGPLSVFESGAILTYLADKHGQFLAPTSAARWKTLEWLAWQVGGLGPMLGQLGYFAGRAPEKLPLAINRFVEESQRLLKVMDGRLQEAPYLGGDYSIADIAAYPWVAGAASMTQGPLAATFAELTATRRWMEAIAARPAVQRGMAVPKLPG